MHTAAYQIDQAFAFGADDTIASHLSGYTSREIKHSAYRPTKKTDVLRSQVSLTDLPSNRPGTNVVADVLRQYWGQ